MDTDALPGSPVVPAELQVRYSGWTWSVAYQYDVPSVTHRLTSSSDEVHFLKLGPADAYPSLSGEAERMDWAQAHATVPRVLGQGSDPETAWLLTAGLPGSDATSSDWGDDPERLVRVLAEAVRTLHAVPIADCPFDFRLDEALAHAKRRVDQGRVDPERDFHPEFAHLSAEAALSTLESTRPSSEDAVVCHGDYCLPNVLIEDWSPAGFIDLGELGVADRWWDLAVATWSLTWNLGSGFEDLFLSSYGIERDQERTDFYRLLYDLVS